MPEREQPIRLERFYPEFPAIVTIMLIAAVYFVTICVQDRIEWFGRTEDGAVVLTDVGAIANERWHWLGERYPYVDLGPYVIMPNHIHVLIGIDNPLQWATDSENPKSNQSMHLTGASRRPPPRCPVR